MTDHTGRRATSRGDMHYYVCTVKPQCNDDMRAAIVVVIGDVRTF